MAESLRMKQDTFTEQLWDTTRRYQEFFQELSVYAKKSAKRKAGNVLSAFLNRGEMPLDSLKKSIPVAGGLDYLHRSIDVVAAMPLDMKETLATFGAMKRTLIRNVFATPQDLSKFYKTLRDGGMLFGDEVEKAVKGAYRVQDCRTHSLMSQLIYLQALSQKLFPEVPRQKSAARAAFDQSHVKPQDRIGAGMAREPKNIRLLRMLKGDFELLSMAQVVADYILLGREEMERREGKSKVRLMLGVLSRNVSDYLSGKELHAATPFLDLPAIRMFHDYIEEIGKTPEGKALQKQYIDVSMFARHVDLWVMSRELQHRLMQMCFSKENVESIDALPETNWQDVRLAREVPSCQRIFFEDSPNPILLTVDPAPGRAYVATVGITPLREYLKMEAAHGSAEAARQNINPLKRPFDENSYMASHSLAFYVRRSDGELALYGDSTSIPKALLGPNYDYCEKIAHYALGNLAHAEYVANHRKDAAPSPATGRPAEAFTGIPDKPSPRLVPPERSAESAVERAFQGRSAHSRLLPAGWLPSLAAWQKAREASETIQLYAEIFDQDGRNPVESIQLDVRSDFKAFRDSLLSLRQRYGDRIRFQTFVQESPGPGD